MVTGGQRACDVTTDHSSAAFYREGRRLLHGVGGDGGVCQVSCMLLTAGKWRVEFQEGRLEVVCAGSVEAEEEIGKQLIVIRRRTFTVRRLTEAMDELQHNHISI